MDDVRRRDLHVSFLNGLSGPVLVPHQDDAVDDPMILGGLDEEQFLHALSARDYHRLSPKASGYDHEVRHGLEFRRPVLGASAYLRGGISHVPLDLSREEFQVRRPITCRRGRRARSSVC